MFEIFESGSRRHIIATADTFESAKAKVDSMGVLFMEDDSDHPGCADAYMNDGRIVVVQPAGFRLG